MRFLLPMILLISAVSAPAAEMANWRLSGPSWKTRTPLAGAGLSLGAAEDIVIFWHPDCAPCLKELAAMPEMATSYPSRHFIVAGLAPPERLQPHLPLSLPQNVEVIAVAEQANEVLLAEGDQSRILPYSLVKGRDGTICSHRYGILAAETLKEWDHRC